METGYPNISKKGSTIAVKFNSFSELKRISNVDFTLDVDSKTQELVGVEIVNLVEKTGVKDPRLEDFEGLVDGINWKISYEPEYDIAYIGFQREGTTSLKTKQAKGAIFADLQGNIGGLEVEV